MPEDITTLRQPRYNEKHKLSPYMRLLLGTQEHLTRILIRTGINSRLITFSWFVTAIVAYGIIAIGTPAATVLGAMVLYLKITLDICDGEVGRFQKRKMDETTDTRTHMQGIYLDRIQHVIEIPIWGLALGWGTYQMTGWRAMFVCGICIAIGSLFQRVDRLLRKTVIADFEQQVRSLGVTAHESETKGDRTLATILSKVLQTGKLWVVNGKRFNLLVFLLGLSDIVINAVLGRVVLIPALLVGAALVWGIYVACVLISVQFSSELLDDAVAELQK